MIPWWRDTPLSEQELALSTAYFTASARSADRENFSTLLAQSFGEAQTSYPAAISAALLSLGGKHGPLPEIYDLLKNPMSAASMLSAGEIVPGFGNMLVKDAPDPIWEEVDTLLKEFEIYGAIQTVQHIVSIKNIYPNPGCYTAAIAIELGIPRDCVFYLVLSSRLGVWSWYYAKYSGNL